MAAIVLFFFHTVLSLLHLSLCVWWGGDGGQLWCQQFTGGIGRDVLTLLIRNNWVGDRPGEAWVYSDMQEKH